jgi:electron transfer flavoprotein alpha subunit
MITVIAETDHAALTLPTLECVEEARDVADGLHTSVHVLLPGHELDELAAALAAHGADQVTLVEHAALRQFSADGWLAALEPLLQEAAPALILAPDSGHGRAWLPRLAARWYAPLVSGCLQVQVGAGAQIELLRPSYGGARHEQLVCPGASTIFATLASGVRGVGLPRSHRRAELVRVTPDLDPAAFRDRALHTLPADPRTVDLSEAELIVSGGLGLSGPEGVEMLRQLADQLGAALGGTRVIADRGWLPTERFIGTTGKIVTPKLYLGFGISGAGQHISGITDSETVIVVNTDRTAPLFSIADLGIVGDLHQIVPELMKQLGDDLVAQ